MCSTGCVGMILPTWQQSPNAADACAWRRREGIAYPVFPRLALLLAETAVDAVIRGHNERRQSSDHRGGHACRQARGRTRANARLQWSNLTPGARGSKQASSMYRFGLAAAAALHAGLRASAGSDYAEVNLATSAKHIIINSQKVTATPRTQAFLRNSNPRRHTDKPRQPRPRRAAAVDRRGSGLLPVPQHSVMALPNTRNLKTPASCICMLECGGAGVVACNWLAPDAGAPFQEIYRDRYCRHGVDLRQQASLAGSRCGRHPA